jgi:hypothetical protein
VNKKGLLVAVFFGTILLTSTVVISIPNLMEPIDTENTKTGTPADNFPDMLNQPHMLKNSRFLLLAQTH